MKMDSLVGERFKERPADCVIDSHALMLRGGYIKNVANGIYSSFAPLRRITRKIETIIREEMDAVGGQEVQFPVVMPASLWRESGRYDTIGDELLRFTDRNGSPMVLGMTHEEAAVHLVRDYANSYTRYPFMIYQIQTKFRDEARPRGGLIRVREFTMKDAYSFHTSQEDLEKYYNVVYKAYERIFARVGIPEVVAVASDSGMMGGAVSHEFILLSPVGEDSIAVCSECGYKANLEAAECVTENDSQGAEDGELKLVDTPDIHTIEDICAFLGTPLEQSCKAVVYQKNASGKYAVVFIRGDLDVNETKLTNFLRESVRPAVITDDCGLYAGYIGPYGLDPEKFDILFDRSLKNSRGLSCGANMPERHYTGLNIARDIGDVEYIDLAKIRRGGICPKCGKPSVDISRGIELGNIFQLGTKYTEAMGMRYIDEDGRLRYPFMGCYGIGLGRLAASVCEARRDEYGPVWPASIAPWQMHLCCLRADDKNCKEVADALYQKALGDNVEVIYDDRNIRPGAMFSDADLLGVPVRVVVSPRNLKDGVCETLTRDKTVNLKVEVGKVLETVENLIAGELKARK